MTKIERPKLTESSVAEAAWRRNPGDLFILAAWELQHSESSADPIALIRKWTIMPNWQGELTPFELLLSWLTKELMRGMKKQDIVNLFHDIAIFSE